jgi:hypothetical protein
MFRWRVLTTSSVSQINILAVETPPKSHGRSAHVHYVQLPARRSPPFLLRRLESGSKCNPGSVNAVQEGLNEEENRDNSQGPRATF